MSVTERMNLKAKANRLGIEGYRTMSLDQLKAAIASAEGAGTKKTAATQKGAAKPTNGTKGAAAAGAAVKGAASTTKTTSTKGAATPAASSAKAATNKGAAAKGAAAKGAADVSKSADKGTTAKGSTSSPAKSTAQKPASSTKGAAAKGTAKRTTSGEPRATRRMATAKTPQIEGKGGYTTLDRPNIDWEAESSVGASGGKRGEVMKWLRKFKGDNAKVFEKVRDNAPAWYPNALKAYPRSQTPVAAAERQLKWLIARVGYDFAYKSGQHLGRAGAFGDTPVADKPATRKAATSKSTKGAATKPAAAKGSTKGAATPAKPKTTAAARTGAQKGASTPAKPKAAANKRTTSRPTTRTPATRGALAVKG